MFFFLSSTAKELVIITAFPHARQIKIRRAEKNVCSVQTEKYNPFTHNRIFVEFSFKYYQWKNIISNGKPRIQLKVLVV